MIGEDIAIELSRITREAHVNLAMKMASGQLGEAFANLDRRNDLTVMRGADRRAQPQGAQDETVRRKAA